VVNIQRGFGFQVPQRIVGQSGEVNDGLETFKMFRLDITNINRYARDVGRRVSEVAGIKKVVVETGDIIPGRE
jgi:hypothetical protein